MPFQKGKPRDEKAGRKKGTPNKDSLPLEEKAKSLGIDPFEILLLFAGGKWKELGYDNEVYHSEKADGSVKMGYTITPEMRLKASSEACQYLLPKKKAVELSNSGDTGFKIVIEDYSKKES